MPGTLRPRLPASSSFPSAVTQSENNLICEVLGPTSPELTLSFKLETQTSAKVSKQQKMVRVENAEVGTWQCLLSDKGKVLLASNVEGERGSGLRGLTPSPSLFICGTSPGWVEATQSPSLPIPLGRGRYFSCCLDSQGP